MADKQLKKNFDWLKEYSWQKGQSGNPKGRPKTKTLKEHAREFLANMSEEGRIQYLKGIKPEEVWRMAEGNPAQDITSKGERLIPQPILGGIIEDKQLELPSKLLDEVHSDNSPIQDIEIKETLEDNTGGNVSQ